MTSDQVKEARAILQELASNGYTPLGYRGTWWSCNFCHKQRESGHEPGCLLGRSQKLLSELGSQE